MRVSANAVRLAALVSAATASGYLWRAALEPGHATTIIRVAPPLIRPQVPAAPAHLPPPTGPVASQGKRADVAVHRRSRSGAPVAERTAAPASRTYAPPRRRPAPKPRPTPKPTPAPTSKPPPTPTPNPPESPAPTEAAPATTPTAPPESSAPPEEAGEGTKPGWGNGDKNHDHGGPPGGKHG